MINMTLLEFAVTPASRALLDRLRQEHDLTDSQIATLLVDWFAAQGAERQQEILESPIAKRRSQELESKRSAASETGRRSKRRTRHRHSA